MNVAGKVNSDANLLAGLLKEVPSSFTVTANKGVRCMLQLNKQVKQPHCRANTNKQMAEIVATKFYCTSI